MVLVPVVKDAINLPVIGGGGISDGRGLAAVLALGGAGVIIGTRLMMTRECPVHDNLKQALLNASELDTMLVMRSINATHRVWINEAAKACAEKEAAGADLAELFKIISGDNTRRLYGEGDLTAGLVALGQGVGLNRDIPTVKELFDRMMEQAEEAFNRFKS
jgi:nitronate monooxygenase